MRAYLDHNATAPIRPCAKDAVLKTLAHTGNGSSVHQEGRSVRSIIESAREDVAKLVGALAKNVIFTSGGTEANQMALSPSWLMNRHGEETSKPVKYLFVSDIEHPSVLVQNGFQDSHVSLLPVKASGVIDLVALRQRVGDFRKSHDGSSFLVSVMGANNETGAIQPTREIADIVHEFGGLLHVDLVQLVGKQETDIEALGADMVSLSAHKIGGPQGVGALVVASEYLALGEPLIRGGGQELRRRAGTENVPGIAGFGAAAREAVVSIDDSKRLSSLKEKLELGLLAICHETTIFADNVPRLPNTTCFAVPGFNAETVVIALDLAGVAVSAGSACSSGKVERSHVLDAMGVEPDLNQAAMRISVGWNSTAAEVDQFLEAWGTIYRRHAQKQAVA